MDSTNCSAYYATDHVFERRPAGSCESSLIALWTVISFVLVIRWLAVIRKWLNYLNRRRRGLRRSLLGPVLNTIIGVLYTGFFMLLFFNLLTAENGWSFSAYSVGYFGFACMYALSLYRMVRLGTKMFTVSSNLGNTSSLERFDCNGMILLTIAFIGLVITTIVLTVLGPIMPENDLLLGILGFASKAVFVSFVTLALIWQLQRCYDLVMERMQESERKTQILQKLRASQRHYTTFGVPISLLFILLATRVIPWYWWSATAIPILLETLAAIFFEFKLWRRKSPRDDGTRRGEVTPAGGEPILNGNSSLASSSIVVVSSTEQKSSKRRLSLGLKSKYKKSRFRAKMTRLTEVTEVSEVPTEAAVTM